MKSIFIQYLLAEKKQYWKLLTKFSSNSSNLSLSSNLSFQCSRYFTRLKVNAIIKLSYLLYYYNDTTERQFIYFYRIFFCAEKS